MEYEPDKTYFEYACEQISREVGPKPRAPKEMISLVFWSAVTVFAPAYFMNVPPWLTLSILLAGIYFFQKRRVEHWENLVAAREESLKRGVRGF